MSSSFSVKRDSHGHYLVTAVLLTVSFGLFCAASIRTFNPLTPPKYGICTESTISQMVMCATLTCLFSFVDTVFAWLSVWGYSCNMLTMHFLHSVRAIWYLLVVASLGSATVMLISMGSLATESKNEDTKAITDVAGCGLPGAVPDLIIMYSIACFFRCISLIHFCCMASCEKDSKEAKKFENGF